MVKEFSSLNENTQKEIRTRNARICLNEEGIIFFIYLPGSEDTLEDAEANVAAIGKVGGGKKRPIFIQPGTHKSMSRESRVYYMKNTPPLATAFGIHTMSPFQNVLATFMSALNKTINKDGFPMRFFNSQEKALVWLRSYLS